MSSIIDSQGGQVHSSANRSEGGTSPHAPAFAPATDPRIAGAPAVLVDEYETRKARGRESRLVRFRAAHPDR